MIYTYGVKNNLTQSLVLFINSLVGSFQPKIGHIHPHWPIIGLYLKTSNYPQISQNNVVSATRRQIFFVLEAINVENIQFRKLI